MGARASTLILAARGAAMEVGRQAVDEVRREGGGRELLKQVQVAHQCHHTLRGFALVEASSYGVDQGKYKKLP